MRDPLWLIILIPAALAVARYAAKLCGSGTEDQWGIRLKDDWNREASRLVETADDSIAADDRVTAEPSIREVEKNKGEGRADGTMVQRGYGTF